MCIRDRRNKAARGIAAAKKNNDAKKVEEIMKEVTTIGSKIERLGILANELLEKRDTLRMKIPNILHESVPIGENDQKNTLHSLHGNKAELDFSAKTHNEILEENAWVDFVMPIQVLLNLL